MTNKSNTVKPTESKRITVRLPTDEFIRWEEYANDNHRGNKSAMIKSLMNNALLGKQTDTGSIDLSKITDEVTKSVTKNIETMLKSKLKKLDLIESFNSDLIMIKTLLSSIVRTDISEKPIDPKRIYDLTYNHIKDLTEEFENEQIYKQLLKNVEIKTFYDEKELDNIGSGIMYIRSTLEQVCEDLYNSTKNEIYQLRSNKFDF